MILVTGGAGFIGSNFVLDWLAAAGEPVVNLDALTYAGNTENLAVAGRRPAPRLRARRHLRPRARRRACSPSTGRARSSTSRPRATSTAASTARPRSSAPTSSARSRCSRRRARTGARSRPTQQGGVPLPPRLDRRGLRLARPGRSGVHAKTHAYEPNSPYSASKAASDHLVRAWHHTYGLPVLITNCSNNYGPYHFPEKLIPLMIVNALAGKPLPVYGDGQQVRDWLYVKDHCARDPRGAGARARRARPTTSAAGNEKPNIEIVADDLRACSTRLQPEPRRPATRRLITYVTDRPGPRPPLRDRRPQDRARARLAAGRDLRDRPRARPCAGTSTTPTGWRACRAAPIATGSTDELRAARADEDPAARQERPGRLGAAALARAARRSGRASTSTAAGRWRADFRDAESLAALVAPRRARRSSSMPPPTPRSTRRESEPELARSHQRRRRSATLAREAAARSAPGWSTTAPTTSSTAAATRRGREDDADRPAQRLRPHQARGRAADPRERLPSPDLPHELGLRGARRQFREDDAAAGRNARRAERDRRPGRRADRRRAARRRDRACVAHRAPTRPRRRRGTYHAVAAGDDELARLCAARDRVRARARRRRSRRSPDAIQRDPTARRTRRPRQRPKNSRLDTDQAARDVRPAPAAVAGRRRSHADRSRSPRAGPQTA